MRVKTAAQATKAASLPPLASGLLQRKCACGGTPGPEGECAECRESRLRLQRSASTESEPSTVRPIVSEVLRSAGQPLDPITRAFMAPRSGHDSSGVRIHANGQAAELAQAVNAFAYTVGSAFIFARDRSARHLGGQFARANCD